MSKTVEKDERTGETDFAIKAIQNFKILLTQDGLFSDIKKFREKWNIDLDISEKIETFMPVVKKIDEKEFFDMITEKWEREKQHPITDLDIEKREERFQDMDSLMAKYKINSLYLEIFKIFLNTNRLFLEQFKSFNPNGAYFFTTRDVDNEKIMAIRIYPETTTDDILAEWSEIEARRDQFLGFNLPKYSERKNIDRDLRIMQLKSLNKNSKEISYIIKEEFKSNQIITYQDINQVIFRIKKLHKAQKLMSS